MFQIVRAGVDIWGTGEMFTVGFDRTSRSMGELWIRAETAPESEARSIGVFLAHRIHYVFEAIDAGDLAPLRALLSSGDPGGDAPSLPWPSEPPGSAPEAAPDFGWRDFDAEYGTLLWMPAADDDRPLLPMVWTCLDTMVEVSFPRTGPEESAEPWQMFLRVNGQSFVSDVTIHDHGLTTSYPLASGLLTAMRGAREMVLAPDGDDQVVLPAQSGDLGARDRFFTWCLMSMERPDATTP
ncbi:hypothetical protein [Alkalilacustris brevis]|uniref:hypothetical protein n=1 Tax=Alkalilacustris brevis TaxID=2026338 RepID=UPI0012D32E82|nr:hypothetical protein [Alkalilacustris brevis]